MKRCKASSVWIGDLSFCLSRKEAISILDGVIGGDCGAVMSGVEGDVPEGIE